MSSKVKFAESYAQFVTAVQILISHEFVFRICCQRNPKARET